MSQLTIALIIFFAYFIWTSITSRVKVKQFYYEYKENGVVTEAVVTNHVRKRKRAHSSNGKIEYKYDSFFPDDNCYYEVYVTFTDIRGEKVERKLADSRRLEIGTPVEIIYLPDKPDSSVYPANVLEDDRYKRFREK